MDNNEKSKVSYIDKSYNQKRKILRRYHITNADAFEMVNMIKRKILKKIKDNKFVNKKEVIETLLVDGFIAFEKIFNDKDEVIDLNKVDPLVFVMNVDDNGQVMWHQNKGTEFARVLYDSQVLYVSSSNTEYFFTSFVEMIYMKMITKDSKYTIKSVVDDMVDSYNENFLKI